MVIFAIRPSASASESIVSGVPDEACQRRGSLDPSPQAALQCTKAQEKRTALRRANSSERIIGHSVKICGRHRRREPCLPVRLVGFVAPETLVSSIAALVFGLE